MAKVLVTGGTGLLGHHILKLAPEGCRVACTVHPAEKASALPYPCDKLPVDVSRGDEVTKAVEGFRPDVVVHTAANGNVDYIEKNREEARRVNLGGTLNVLEACARVGARCIYISSNAVFDGEKAPYREGDPVCPLNYYGELKVQEEEAVSRSGLRCAIVRPILMYGWNLKVERQNPVTWQLDLMRAGKELRMVDDIFCNPLYAPDCAEAVWRILSQDKTGVYHVGGEDELSRYEFAVLTAEAFGLDPKLVLPVKNSTFKEIAPRPRNTTYRIDKIKKELGLYPLGVRQGLAAMAKDRSEGD